MGSFLGKPLEFYIAAKNIIESAGMFLISQFESSSEAFERHQLRKINVESTQIFLTEEARSIATARDTLRKKYSDATPEERIRIRRDIEDAEKDLRQLKTTIQAITYLPQFAVQPSNECVDTLEQEHLESRISDHWMDKFNQLARSKNEEWRQDLLSRALAAEATKPGSVCPRALWLIGTLEEDKFQAFAAILDISSVIDDVYIIPNTNLFSLDIPSCQLGQNVQFGALTYYLNDTGLIADYPSSLMIKKDQKFRIDDNKSCYTINCKDNLSIAGLVPSTIGSSIAVFYERNMNPFGQKILNDWLASLDSSLYEIDKQYIENTGLESDSLTIRCTGFA